MQSVENVRLFLKNAWKKKYVRFLLYRAESVHISRCNEYYGKTGLEMIDQLQGESFVTEEERRTIEFQQLGSASPPRPLVLIKGFPTPAVVVKKITEPNLRKMLARLNSEYEYLCSFAHGDAEATFFRTFADKRSPFHTLHTTSEIEKFYQEQVLEPPILYSALSSILVATEIASAFPAEVELRAKLVEAWNFLTKGSLMVVSAWETRAQRVLGILDI
jgi:hypothetical protein